MLRAGVFVFVALLAGVSLAQTPAARCSWDTAQRVTVRDLDRSEEFYKGWCVRISGQLNGRSVSVSRASSLNGGDVLSVGAYFQNETLRTRFVERPRRAEALGVVGQCRDVCGGETRDEAFCTPLGHCHYEDDPYVVIQAVR